MMKGAVILGGSGPEGALIDPGAEEGDLLASQGIRLLRHGGEILEGVRGGEEEEAFGGFTGDESGTPVAALEGEGSGIEAQAVLGPIGAVALDAGCLQDRLDIPAELDGLGEGGGDFGQIHGGVDFPAGEGDRKRGRTNENGGEHGRTLRQIERSRKCGSGVLNFSSNGGFARLNENGIIWHS